MDLFEFVALTWVPISALIAVKFGRKVWIRYDIVGTIIFALSFVFSPELGISMILNTPFLTFHHFLCAVAGVRVLWVLLNPLFRLDIEDQDEAADNAALYGFFYSRIIEHSLVLLDNIVSYSEGTHFNYKYLVLSSGALVHLICNVYLFVKAPKPAYSNNSDFAKVDTISKIEFYVLLLKGFALYAFPDTVLLVLAGPQALNNEGYRSLVRTTGAFTFALSFASMHVFMLKFGVDRKRFFLSRICGGFLDLVVIISGYIYFNILSLQALGGLVLMSLAYIGLVAYGYMNTPEDKKKKPQ